MKDWMKTAVKPSHKGIFKKKAAKAGMDVQEYAQKVTKPSSKASPKLKKEAVLAKTFAKFRP